VFGVFRVKMQIISMLQNCNKASEIDGIILPSSAEINDMWSFSSTQRLHNVCVLKSIQNNNFMTGGHVFRVGKTNVYRIFIGRLVESGPLIGM
jgi:hypothetical protein